MGISLFTSRGQLAIEFMAVVAFLLLTFIILQLFFYQASSNAQQQRLLIYAQKLGRETASKMDLAAGSTGIVSQLVVPAGIGDYLTPYSITVTNSSVAIAYSYGQGSQSVLTPVRVLKVDNGTGASSFNLSTGTYLINNTAGTIYVIKQ